MATFQEGSHLFTTIQKRKAYTTILDSTIPPRLPPPYGSNLTSASAVPAAGWSEHLWILPVVDVARSNSSGMQAEVRHMTSMVT